MAKEEGSGFAGTILDNGTIQVEADRVGEDTFGRIIELVEEAQDSKSEAERFIDRFAVLHTGSAGVGYPGLAVYKKP